MTNPVVVELRKFKSSQAQSEETLNFSAQIFVDGKQVGYVSNEGRGGSCLIMFQDREVEKRVTEYVKTLPTEKADFGEITITMDFFFARLADEMVAEKKNQRLVAKANKRGMKAYILIASPTTQYEVLVFNEAEMEFHRKQLAFKRGMKPEDLKVKALN